MIFSPFWKYYLNRSLFSFQTSFLLFGRLNTVLILQVSLVLKITYVYSSYLFSLKFVSLCVTFPPAVESRDRWMLLDKITNKELCFFRTCKNPSSVLKLKWSTYRRLLSSGMWPHITYIIFFSFHGSIHDYKIHMDMEIVNTVEL